MDSLGATPAAKTNDMTSPIIIPVAAGKGGVGKTLLTANLAMALSDMEHQTIAVDLEFGGSNLHSYLGLSNEHPGVGDFLAAKSAELPEMLVETGNPRLQFLPGDGRTPFMANLSYAQKRRLISRLRLLPAEYVLLDLGSGSSFNTLDLFRLSTCGILVTVPERPAIMNMQVFLKHLCLRTIQRKFSKNREIRNLLDSLRKLPMSSGLMTIDVIRDRIAKVDIESAKAVDEICQQNRPHVIFNMGEHPDELKIAEKISQGMGQVLSIEADYLGFVFRDRTVIESIRNGTPRLPYQQKGQFSENMRRIASRIVRYWDVPVENSAELLLKSTRADFERWRTVDPNVSV